MSTDADLHSPDQPADASAPAYPPAQMPAPRPQKTGTNALAIVSLIGAFVFALVGVICGHIALSQIKRTGEGGRGLAIAGLVIGYLSILATIILTIAVVVVGSAAASRASDELAAQSSADTASALLNSECSRLDSAEMTFESQIGSATDTLSEDPASGQAAVSAAVAAFKASEASVTVPKLKAELAILNQKLDAFTAAVGTFVATPADSQDPTAITDAADAVEDEWNNSLMALCR